MYEELSKGKKMAAFTGIAIVQFMAMFLIAGVGVYGYTVASIFGSVEQVGMIFTLESAARCVVMPLSGKIGDRIGQKKCFLIALLVYIIAYGVAGAATSFWMFAIARMITGFAWGMFVTNILVLVTTLFGQEEGPRYSGIAQAVATVAMIVAAPVAGFLCALNWRLEFFVSLPVLAVGFILCAVGLPAVPKAETIGKKMDIGGCIATFIILLPFSLAMNFGNTYGWTSPLILALIALVVIGAIMLIISEKKAEDPIYPAKLLGNKFYLSIFVISLCYSVANAVANYMPTYAQYVLGANTTIAGFLTTPGLIIAAILTVVFGNVAAKTGKYKKMVMLWSFMTLITGILYLFLNPMAARNPGLALVFVFISMLPMGAVNSVQQIAPYTYPMKVLKPEELAGGMAFMGLSGILGNTISSGVLGALMNTAGGIGTILYAPIFLAIVMVIFAFMFKDIKQGETL